MNVTPINPLILASLPTELQDSLNQFLPALGAAVAGYAGKSTCNFDIETIADLETYLSKVVKQRIIKWGEGAERYEYKRIVTIDGHASSSAKKIEFFERGTNALGFLNGYCIANITRGAFTTAADGDIWVKSGDPRVPDFNGLFKVRKFLRNGAEDSLVHFVSIIQDYVANDQQRKHMIEMTKKAAEKEGIVLPEDYRTEVWQHACADCRAQGHSSLIERVVFLTADGEILIECESTDEHLPPGEPEPFE